MVNTQLMDGKNSVGKPEQWMVKTQLMPALVLQQAGAPVSLAKLDNSYKLNDWVYSSHILQFSEISECFMGFTKPTNITWGGRDL